MDFMSYKKHVFIFLFFYHLGYKISTYFSIKTIHHRKQKNNKKSTWYHNLLSIGQGEAEIPSLPHLTTLESYLQAFRVMEYSSSSSESSLSGSNSVSLPSWLSRSNPRCGVRKLPMLNFFLGRDRCRPQQSCWPVKKMYRCKHSDKQIT